MSAVSRNIFDDSVERINQVQDHANQIILATENQYKGKFDAKISTAAITQIIQKAEKAREDVINLANSGSKTFAKDVKKIRNDLIKELGKILADYNEKVLVDYVAKNVDSTIDPNEFAKDVHAINTNTRRGKMLKFAAKFTSYRLFQKRATEAKRKLEIYKRGKEELEMIAKDVFLNEFNDAEKVNTLDKMDMETLSKVMHERKKTLARSAGIVGAKGIYLVDPSYNPKKAAKQITSLINQNLNLKERVAFGKSFTIDGNNHYRTDFVPLNKSFDDWLGNESEGKVSTTKYGEIYGTRGAGSAYREVEHLINGYLSTLNSVTHDPELGDQVQQVNQVLRHGILAMRFETDPAKRREVAQQMTRELLTAGVLISIAKSGKSLAEVAASPHPWRQAVISLSLVTPDMFMSIPEKTKNLGKKQRLRASEEGMWRSQQEALQNMDKLTLRSKSGLEIKVEFETLPFNTGVNKGTVKFYAGTSEQHKEIKQKVARLEKLANDVTVGYAPTSKRYKEVQALLKDIKKLSRTSTAYLKSGNQYELGAKIEILTNRLSDIVEEQHKKGVKYQDNQHYDGITALINCMSAKDRTGVMLANIYTLEEMKKRLGRYPTNDEMKDVNNQNTYIDIYVQMLKEYGGLDISKLNTDAEGYKVRKEVMVYPNAPAWQKYPGFFEAIIGLAPTAGA